MNKVAILRNLAQQCATRRGFVCAELCRAYSSDHQKTMWWIKYYNYEGSKAVLCQSYTLGANAETSIELMQNWLDDQPMPHPAMQLGAPAFVLAQCSEPEHTTATPLANLRLSKKESAEGTITALRFAMASRLNITDPVVCNRFEFDDRYYPLLSEPEKIEWIEACIDYYHDGDDPACSECGKETPHGELCADCQAKFEACPDCAGLGEVEWIDRNAFFDPIQIKKCEYCEGTGKRNH